MLRFVWFAVKVGVLVAAAVWIADLPGIVTLHWMDYTIEAKAWFVLTGALLVLLSILFLHRAILTIVEFPDTWGRYRDWRRQRMGQRALTLGMAAVAAGDKKLASYQAHRARKFLPRDKGLTVMLEANSARLKGDEAAARAAYMKLLANRDTAFLGMRGLLTSALERGRLDEALTLSRNALEMHPRQPWLLQLVYRIELRERRWEDALRTLRRVEKAKALPENTVRRDRQAILLRQAEDFFDNSQARAGSDKLKQAYRIDPSFVPAALRLAEHYIETGQRRSAVKLISKTWPQSPHPALASLWGELAPPNRSNEYSTRLRWFEKLVALRPDSEESQLAAAHAAIDDHLWGEARQYLKTAESIRPTARLYRLRSLMEERLSHPSEARYWLDKAADATPDPVWTCRETGQVYERWSPVAEPHGAFNTMVWDYPQVRGGKELSLDLGMQDLSMLPRLRA